MIYLFVVSFSLGILIEKLFGFGWSAGLTILILSLISALVIWKDNKKIAKIILILGIAFCLGIFRMTIIDLSPDQNLLNNVSNQVSFEATVLEEPDTRDSNTRYIIKPENSKSLILLVANRFPKLEYGDRISVSGKLDLPKNFISDNGVEFDYISYLSKDKIHFIIYQPQTKRLESGGNPIVAALYSLKHFLVEKISEVIPEPNASLVSGLIFGTKQSLGTELLEKFKDVGLIHIIVLSGYNITVIAIGIFYFTSFFGRRNLGFIVASISIVLFALMVGLGATVIRASIMALIGILARFLGRPADALRWLFIAGFLMLFWNPLILLQDPSFQLSFMATLGLILFSPIVYNFISKKLSFITEKLALREIIASTLAVQIFILPLLLKMSGSISIIAFIINPIVLPIIPVVMALGGITSVIGVLTKILAWPFGTLAYVLTELIIKIVEFGASLPFSTFKIGNLPLWLLITWYTFYAFIFVRLKNSFQPPPNSN